MAFQKILTYFTKKTPLKAYKKNELAQLLQSFLLVLQRCISCEMIFSKQQQTKILGRFQNYINNIARANVWCLSKNFATYEDDRTFLFAFLKVAHAKWHTLIKFLSLWPKYCGCLRSLNLEMYFWCLQFLQKTNLKIQISALPYWGRNISFVFFWWIEKTKCPFEINWPLSLFIQSGMNF